MKKIVKYFGIVLAIVVCVPFFSACGPKEEEIIPETKLVSGETLSDENNKYIKWQGRYEYKQATQSDKAQVALYFAATGFTVDFYGTYLKVNFLHSGTNIYYNFALDDEVLPNTKVERRFVLPDEELDKTVTLVSGLNQGHHTITCLKMDEPRDAYTAVTSFETDGGFYERNTAQDNQKTKFMFVCASGGSGFGALSYSETNSNVDRTRKNSSCLHSFNYLTARMFDADVQYVAQAGWGVSIPNHSVYQVLDYCGITTENTVNAAKKTALWDYNKYVPDVIIFNIGGNDTKQSSFNLNTYKADVVAMVQKLHEKYPNAKMLWTHTGSKAGNYSKDALRTSGILGAGYLEMVTIPSVGEDGSYGAAEHFSFKSHITSANILANTIQTRFGLNKVRENVVFNDYLGFIEMH